MTLPTSDSTGEVPRMEPGLEEAGERPPEGPREDFAIAGPTSPFARRGAGMSRTRGVIRVWSVPTGPSAGDPRHEEGPRLLHRGGDADQDDRDQEQHGREGHLAGRASCAHRRGVRPGGTTPRVAGE